jgi:antitoxin component YwqK of YwqJK toxin-antitoxin module
VLLEKGDLKQGVQVGIRELYFPDGKVNVRERYVNGKMDDLCNIFTPMVYCSWRLLYQREMYGLWRKYIEGEIDGEVWWSRMRKMVLLLNIIRMVR